METLRILVTDDEAGMRTAVTRALDGFSVQVPDADGTVGFTVEGAESGEAAIAVIDRDPPDVLLLDHKMPGISGLEVLDRLNGMKHDMLTIMITAYASIETAVTATKRGAYDFLAKPFTPAELRSAISKAAARVVLGKQARRLAEEKRQVRFQFIRVLGHELKAPLGAVDGYLEMLEQRTLGTGVDAYAAAIGRCRLRIEGMRKLIADLLDMTHIESGRRRRLLAPYDLREAAAAAVETLRPEASERHVAVAVEDGPPLVITADRSEIDMIFNNLVSNAIKYNRCCGRVDVSMGRELEGVTISVSDTGIGMTPDETARLFGEFVRIRNAKTADVLGSGLGLSIVKKIAELYEGRVSVASVADEGSTLTVFLHDPGDIPPAGAPAFEASQTS